LPVTGGKVAIGLGIGALWMLMFGVQANTARAYGWLTIVAAVLAWAVCFVLAKFGDRGIAVGAAAAAGIGLGVVGLIAAIDALNGHSLLW
jgi:hypothetical protein